MRGGFAFSIGFHLAVLLVLIFGLQFWHSKPREIPPMISVDVIDMSKEATTNKIAPANKVEKTVRDETQPPPPPVPPHDMSPTPLPQIEPVDNAAPQVDVPDVALKKQFQPTVTEPDSVDAKVAELTPPPPAVLKRPQPKPPAPSFDSVLKNLAKLKPQEASTPTQTPSKTPAKPATGALAQLSDKLTASEMDALKQQLALCWNIPAGAKNAQNLVVELDVDVGPDRVVTRADIVDQGRVASDPIFRAAATSATRALRMPQCTPLALPADKYEEWKSMTLRFDPKEMLGQ